MVEVPFILKSNKLKSRKNFFSCSRSNGTVSISEKSSSKLSFVRHLIELESFITYSWQILCSTHFLPIQTQHFQELQNLKILPKMCLRYIVKLIWSIPMQWFSFFPPFLLSSSPVPLEASLLRRPTDSASCQRIVEFSGLVQV